MEKRNVVWQAGLVAILALVAVRPIAAAEPEPFDGPFLGFDLGRHNVIGGSLVGGVDVLKQEARAALTLLGGFRKQLGAGVVIGIEGGYGWLDGDLQLADPEGGLVIDYAADGQSHVGLTLGHTLGASRRVLVFGYLNEMSRSFDVTIRSGSESLRQGDEQGLLRYGIGAEVSLGGLLRARATAGSSRAKFEGETNIEPETKLEASIGLVLQF